MEGQTRSVFHGDARTKLNTIQKKKPRNKERVKIALPDISVQRKRSYITAAE